LTPPLPSAVTSSAIGIEKNSVLVMGCSDGNMYGIDVSKPPQKTWSTDVRGAMVRGRPTAVDDRIIVGASDGKLYIFDASKPGSKRASVDLVDPAAGAGARCRLGGLDEDQEARQRQQS